MMSRIVSFAALAVVSMAVDSSEDDAAAAVKEAQKAAKAFEAGLADFRQKSDDKKDVQAMANKFLQPAGNYTRKTWSVVLGNLYAAEAQQKKEMRALRSDAMKAARSIKVAARKAALASKKAGMSESVYEVVEEGADGMSESMQDSAENLGDEAEDAVEKFYQKIEGEVERQLDTKAREAEQKERQEQRKERAQQERERKAQQKDQAPKEQQKAADEKTPTAPKEQQTADDKKTPTTSTDELKPDGEAQASSQQKTSPAQALATITPADLSSFAYAAAFASALAVFGLALRSRLQQMEPASSAYAPLIA